MFFVDKPYISDLFKTTVRDYDIPVIDTDKTKNSSLLSGTKIVSKEQAISTSREDSNLKVYTTSENSISWIVKHLAGTGIPQRIDLFKDKLKFRRMTQPLFPDLFFKEVRVQDLLTIQVHDIHLPFIIKPTVGFFSMGVYKVSSYDEWKNTADAILEEIDQIKDLYPEEVLDTSSFIIEQCINGDEYALDAYYDASGDPVILGIFKHIFASDSDVSDRVYISSKNIIESNLLEFTDFTREIGALAKVTNFPVHIELRREHDGTLLPIEVNPMRFGGWCSTADMSSMAYEFNPYLYYYLDKKPDWPTLLKEKEGKLFSLIVLDNSTGIDGDEIISFDYEKVLSGFEKVLELRKIDYRIYPVFGFLFTETREDNFIELENILNSDLNEFTT